MQEIKRGSNCGCSLFFNTIPAVNYFAGVITIFLYSIGMWSP